MIDDGRSAFKWSINNFVFSMDLNTEVRLPRDSFN